MVKQDYYELCRSVLKRLKLSMQLCSNLFCTVFFGYFSIQKLPLSHTNKRSKWYSLELVNEKTYFELILKHHLKE
ncbi:hypothetical protein BpHYR1_049571 [Brachionus plicatilis]|uniref:Uncharacterized protein n=1 Tax=Brachionus plicatilis TaxID=10195 RepID=A0A3M7P4H3_BRAPC|nr:hypothetical protein BpHYR1_049571 [Brachionus plicatilis]